MIKIKTIMLISAILLFLSSVARAEISLFASRVMAEDEQATAEFYMNALGLKEVNRLAFAGGSEIMLNFGATEEEAKANTNAQVVILHRESDEMEDTSMHLIFNVTDMTATVAAIRAAGGIMQGEPVEFGNTGIFIGVARDPAGNLVELIQQPTP